MLSPTKIIKMVRFGFLFLLSLCLSGIVSGYVAWDGLPCVVLLPFPPGFTDMHQNTWLRPVAL